MRLKTKKQRRNQCTWCGYPQKTELFYCDRCHKCLDCGEWIDTKFKPEECPYCHNHNEDNINRKRDKWFNKVKLKKEAKDVSSD